MESLLIDAMFVVYRRMVLPRAEARGASSFGKEGTVQRHEPKVENRKWRNKKARGRLTNAT